MNQPVASCTIALVAGEASGDQLGGALIRSLSARLPNARFVGIGGSHMQSAGLDAWWQSDELSVMGLAEVVRHLPRLLRLRRDVRERLITLKPDVFIGIDAPDFNLGLEKTLKATGIKTIHYVSPTVWAWRQKRAAKMGRATNKVLCLFPFEPPFFEGYGVSATYVGHPMADAIEPGSEMLAARNQLGLDPLSRCVALLPGSRHSEVSRLTGPLLDAAEILNLQYDGICFAAPMANASVHKQFASALEARKGLDCKLVDGDALKVMAAADVVVCASGTATLETMLVNRPMVVIYRLSALTFAISRSFRLIKSKFIALPNILANESLVPELIQGEASGMAIAEHVSRWLDRPEACAELSQTFHKLHRQLRVDAAERAADAVMESLDGPA
jgi:lipid-A-disaccharide synthase